MGALLLYSLSACRGSESHATDLAVPTPTAGVGSSTLGWAQPACSVRSRAVGMFLSPLQVALWPPLRKMAPHSWAELWVPGCCQATNIYFKKN